MARAAFAVVLGLAVAYATVWPLFVLVISLDGLDGVVCWNAACDPVDRRTQALGAASGAAVTGGLWTAYAGWLRRRRWWRHGLASFGAGLLLFGAAVAADASSRRERADVHRPGGVGQTATGAASPRRAASACSRESFELMIVAQSTTATRAKIEPTRNASR